MADMRGERTKELLCSALLDILKTKPLERTTVKEVLERASVSKKAFYNHYSDIFDLAIDCYLNPTGFGGGYAPPAAGVSGVDACLAVLQSILAQIEFSRANPNLARSVVMNLGRSPYYDRAQAAGGVDYLTGFIADVYGESAIPLITCDVCARYIFNGATGLCRDWMRAGMVEPPLTIAKRCLLLNLQCASIMMGKAIDSAVVDAIEKWEPVVSLPCE